jgi:predicted metal-dependent peptidase
MSEALRSWLGEFISRRDFLGKYPYYAAVLGRMEPVEDASVPVMAVSARGRRLFLHVNVDFFTRPPQNVQYLRGVLLHEVHHVVLGHLSLEKFRRVPHPELMELAMEVSANEFIREPLPGDPPLWTDFAALGLAAGQSTRERYELLVKALEQGRIITLPAWFDCHRPDGVGGVYGQRLPEPGAAGRLRQLLADVIGEVADKAARENTAKPGGLLAGRDPGRLLEELHGVEAPPQCPMDWKTALGMFVAQVRTPVRTYRRPNRRYPTPLGLVPGRMYYPTPDDPRSMLVAIDTSGSMTSGELNEIARQLRALSRQVRFVVAECDAVIQRVYEFDGKLTDVAGRGGTDLRPVFEPEFIREHRPAGVIYFTDGESPWPADDPGIKTLWVLTKPLPFGCAWGQQTYLRA